MGSNQSIPPAQAVAASQSGSLSVEPDNSSSIPGYFVLLMGIGGVFISFFPPRSTDFFTVKMRIYCLLVGIAFIVGGLKLLGVF